MFYLQRSICWRWEPAYSRGPGDPRTLQYPQQLQLQALPSSSTEMLLLSPARQDNKAKDNIRHSLFNR